MTRTTAAQRAATHLQLSGTPTLIAPRSTKTLDPTAPGAVLEMEKRRRRGGWLVRVWRSTADYTTEPRPRPEHRLWVQEDGQVIAEPTDPALRTRGRPRIHFDGKAQRDRLHITPHEQDLTAIKHIADTHHLTESAVGAALLAKALRGVKLPWD